MSSESPIHVIGAGPAGLKAAERLAQAGRRVVVHERMPSVARKFLMAGRGGLNLTHSEPLDRFRGRYAEAESAVSPWLDRFTPADMTVWSEGLGQDTFVGSSGRVFPSTLKASPLLRAWLARLDSLGVEVRTRSRWTGWRGDVLTFDTPDGERIEPASALVLALGGASWPRLGSDGGWRALLEAEGVAVTPFRPANAGVDIAWSAPLVERFAGTPLKGIALSLGEHRVRGEAMVSAYGLEGGAVYALFAAIRESVERDGRAMVTLDLRPDSSAEDLARRLSRPRGKDSVSNWLRKSVGLASVAIALLREAGDIPTEPEALAKRLKALPLTVTDVQGLERAISSAGGVRLDQVDDRLMLSARPGVFVAGEMLDWEAPTGGYLLQASFASGVVAADGVLAWLSERG